MIFPPVKSAEKLTRNKKRLLIAAYGFEKRSVGWARFQKGQGTVLESALIIKYLNPKGKNRVEELQKAINNIGIDYPLHLDYDIFSPHNIETLIQKRFEKLIPKYDEVIIDITGMTKFLILICLCNLTNYNKCVRIVYCEANEYAPSKKSYITSKAKMEELAKFPSRGFETILRAKCLSSIRMQGQPVVLVAFTSFNEQLIRHMLGTINPHRLLFINGRPPRKDYKWREIAIQEIHSKLINEYPIGNETNAKGMLTRVSSTLDYAETVMKIDEIYKKYGLFERIIIAATGSKMQTVGLFLSKMMHPDMHIEYPTPDSYFVTGMSIGINKIHEIKIDSFASFLSKLSAGKLPNDGQISF
jgi:hypothetical protein